MITIFINGALAESKRIQFSDGAVEYRLLNKPAFVDFVHYSVSPQTNVNEVITEMAVVESLFSGYTPTSKTLYLPYLPYARADRKFSDLGSDGLNSFLSLLATFKFSEVFVKDPHNHSVIPQGFTVADQLTCLKSVQPDLPMSEYDAVVSPDKGAITKAVKIADHYQLPLVVCGKTRSSATGALSNPEIVQGDVNGKRVIIVDDICDGGYTFIQLADLLYSQGAKSVDLYVTHLIASKGLSVFAGKINRIFFYQTIGSYVTREAVFNFNKGAL